MENNTNSLKNPAQQIMMIDDDIDIMNAVQAFLERNYFDVTLCDCGEQAVRHLSKNTTDLIILDKHLTNEDGVLLTKRLRQFSHAPIIMLTANDDETEQVIALESGIDAYMTKPFKSRVLLAYIHAVLRSKESIIGTPKSEISEEEKESLDCEQEIYECHGWRLNCTSHKLFSSNNQEISLTAGEYTLLSVLFSNPNRVLSRDQLLSMTRKEDVPFDRSIDTLISRVRRRLDQPKWIKTIRNLGYLLDANVKRIHQTTGNN